MPIQASSQWMDAKIIAFALNLLINRPNFRIPMTATSNLQSQKQLSVILLLGPAMTFMWSGSIWTASCGVKC